MKTFHRVTAVSVVLGSIVLVFFGLTYVSTKTEGPLARALTVAGVVLGEMENSIVKFFRGPGREAELAWLQPYRSSVSVLRTPDTLLLGAFDNNIPQTLDGILRLEEAIGARMPLIHFYAAWGDQPEQQFPSKLVRAIWNLGSLAVITWEPWLTDFENVNHPHLPLRDVRDRGGAADIARGAYDFYLDQWAADAAAFGKPLFVRLAHEMNDPYRYPWGPQNNSIEDFLAAWCHIVTRFKVAGAENVVWVWSPHVAYEYYPYYPGDEYVDWVATQVLNYGTVAPWSRWWSVGEIFGNHYLYLAALNKPIMVAEFSSLAVGGDRSAWFRDALHDFPARFPAVKALLFFHHANDATITYQHLDWSFARDSTVSIVVREAIRKWGQRTIQNEKLKMKN